ncbi:hypothetical protein NVP1063O_029 [Vibrio phage 1.063.O._10N.261.45.C7]|nr:hypothetical protein NVP1063O_029 [Vibrio phage 1.063.O._10N.261.45.C7]
MVLEEFTVPRSGRVQTFELIGDKVKISLTGGQHTYISFEHYPIFSGMLMKAQYDKTISGYYVHVKQDDGTYTTLTKFLSKDFVEGEIDHKSRNTLDNTIENLRLASKQQQMFNQKRSCGVKNIYETTYRGVTKRKDSGNYRTRAQRLDYSQHNVGNFYDEVSAARAWDIFMFNEYKDDHPLKGYECNGILPEPTLNFIMFNFPEELLLN